MNEYRPIFDVARFGKLMNLASSSNEGERYNAFLKAYQYLISCGLTMTNINFGYEATHYSKALDEATLSEAKDQISRDVYSRAHDQRDNFRAQLLASEEKRKDLAKKNRRLEADIAKLKRKLPIKQSDLNLNIDLNEKDVNIVDEDKKPTLAEQVREIIRELKLASITDSEVAVDECVKRLGRKRSQMKEYVIGRKGEIGNWDKVNI